MELLCQPYSSIERLKGWRPCLYFAIGYYKNGTNCGFALGGLGDSDGLWDDYIQVCSRAKSFTAHRCYFSCLFSQVHEISSSTTSERQSESCCCCFDLGEDMHNLCGGRLDRNDLINPASRQIYVMFPADSTFREEYVSNYFSIYGLVPDVRIPYQQKRMFGFITFVYPETVKIMIAKGNPHF